MLKPILFIVALIIVVLVGVVLTKLYNYPKAQIAGATGSPAPDFTLPDAQGQRFTLSSQRGHKVVLYFYRGYW